jgi:hypothetical protein
MRAAASRVIRQRRSLAAISTPRIRRVGDLALDEVIELARATNIEVCGQRRDQQSVRRQDGHPREVPAPGRCVQQDHVERSRSLPSTSRRRFS